MRFSPSSAVLGALAASLGLLLVSASPLGPQILRVVVGNSVQVKGIPDPADMIRIVEGTQYIVPTGKTLVLTGVVAGEPTAALTTYYLSYTIMIDGNLAISSTPLNSSSPDVFFWGYAVQAGSMVEIDDPFDWFGTTPAGYKATILAYLADA